MYDSWFHLFFSRTCQFVPSNILPHRWVDWSLVVQWLNRPNDSCMLHTFSTILQCWVTSTECMSGIFSTPRKVAKYEKQWHSNVFLPCLKKLRAEVSLLFVCYFFVVFFCSYCWMTVSCSRHSDYSVTVTTPCLLQFLECSPNPLRELVINIRYSRKLLLKYAYDSLV